MELGEQDAGATPKSGDTVRVILYLDKQVNGATASATLILESANYQSFNNLSNSGRFCTLMDRTYTLNHTNLASDGAGVVSSSNIFVDDSFYKDCNIPIEFNSTSGVITEISSNNIGVLLLAKVGEVAFESKMRLRFSDK